MKLNKKCILLITAILISLLMFSGCSLAKKHSSSKSDSKTETTKNLLSSENTQDDLKDSSDDSDDNTDTSDNNDSENSVDSSNVSSAESTITPAVWEVTNTNGNTIYMMGSIHMADSDATVLPEYFENAYAGCDYLAVECDITNVQLNSISAYKQLMYLDGTTIKDHVSAESYDKVVEILKNAGQYISSYDYMKPIMWVDLIEIAGANKSGLSDKYGVDVNLINRAKSEGKEVLEVESVEFQYSLLANLSDNIQSMLFDSIAHDEIIETTIDEITSLYDKWKTGTMTAEDASESTDAEDLTEEEVKLLEEYNNILLYNRNVGMADKAIEYMNDGKKVMFVVGAAHFYGDKGILKLMENAGCTVSRITPDSETVSEMPDAA